ncbi:hypothetical protein E2P81_ATG04499 [Venturia nashicola]|nr:hypothetical protein E2P81_ATG04499 [Venturia nashicola]
MSPMLSDLSLAYQLRIYSLSSKYQWKFLDKWERTGKTYNKELRMMIYNECFNKRPSPKFGLSPQCLAYVRDLCIEIPYFISGQERQDMLSYLDTLCYHLGEHLQPGLVHLILEISYFNKGQYQQDIIGSIGPLSNLPQMASVRIYKKHEAPDTIQQSCSATSRSEFKWFCQKTFAFLITDSPSPTQDLPKRPFKFQQLPVELQDLILSYSGLISPNPVLLPQSPLTSPMTSPFQRRCCCHCSLTNSIGECYCNNADVYSSTCTCPTPLLSGLFLVNHEIHSKATEIFYRNNTFALGIGYLDNITGEISALPPKIIRQVRKLEIIFSVKTALESYSASRHVPAMAALFDFFKEKLEMGRLDVKIKILNEWYQYGGEREDMKACIRASGFEKYCDIELVEYLAWWQGGF